MRLAIDLDMTYRVGARRTVMLAIEAARSAGQSVVSETLSIDGSSLHRIPGESGVGTRLWARLEDGEMRLRYRAEVDVTRADIPLESCRATPIHTLPAEALTFLRPSRFCQSDEFTAFASNRFSHVEGGAKVAAIRDWVSSEVMYLHASSDATTTVVDTFARRAGVCRDFTHLVCALARAANIPARYASVYAPGVDPPDFHAVAEVWLDGQWHLVDATGMSTPGNTVLIGVGRDACDAPFMETEDEASLIAQGVSVSRISGGNAP